jgi:UDP-2,3-diacylglucosamine pyrophosphatase LpxH
VKAKVKSAISFISDYEEQLCEVAKANKCDGVICGHIHQAADKMIGDIHYLNSGDWVETMSILAEDHEGKWEIIYYTDWLQQKHLSSDKIDLPVLNYASQSIAHAG